MFPWLGPPQAPLTWSMDLHPLFAAIEPGFKANGAPTKLDRGHAYELLMPATVGRLQWRKDWNSWFVAGEPVIESGLATELSRRGYEISQHLALEVWTYICRVLVAEYHKEKMAREAAERALQEATPAQLPGAR